MFSHSEKINTMQFNPMQFNPMMQSPLRPFKLFDQQEKMNASKGVWANEIPLLGYINLRGNAQKPAFREAVNTALNVALPAQACTITEGTWGSILWLSPDEWLIVCKRSQRASLQQSLEAALTGVHSQVVDNSGGYTMVEIKGTHARDVLHHATVYDLNKLTAGKVVGTTFGKLNTYLYPYQDGFVLIFRRSFADYIWRYLARSALPYGFGIAELNNDHSHIACGA